ncbi:MAG: hypothetical protein R8K22_08250 [Mariprofundaceae bacterium]
MKIQGTGKVQGQKIASGKKARSDGAFQSLLNAEMTTEETTKTSENQQKKPDKKQASIVLEEAVHVLDQTLKQLESGNIPDNQTLDTIQQLRIRLQEQNTSNASELQQADTLLAVEAERIKSLHS